MNQNIGNCVINSGAVGNIYQHQSSPVAAPAYMSTTKNNPHATEGQKKEPKIYDIALSYSGEQEQLVSRVAKILEAEGFAVFFAPYQESTFIGEDMFTRFYRIYRYESRYVAAFVTADYLQKEIPMHEATTAMLRRRDEGRNCLIPIYFGNATLPNLDSDINYISADGLREVELADKIRAVICATNR